MITEDRLTVINKKRRLKGKQPLTMAQARAGSARSRSSVDLDDSLDDSLIDLAVSAVSSYTSSSSDTGSYSDSSSSD